MAGLDTIYKRGSSIQLMLSFVIAPVFPDGSVQDEYDRKHIAHVYSGIPSSSSSISPTFWSFSVIGGGGAHIGG